CQPVVRMAVCAQCWHRGHRLTIQSAGAGLMSQDIAARLPLLGAFGLRRRVVGRSGRPACLALITALLPGAGLAIAVAGCGGPAARSLAPKSPGAGVPG